MNLERSNEITYLNTAAVGLVSPESVVAAQQFQKGTTTNAAATFIDWMGKNLPVLREKVAGLLKGQSNQIAFTPNFSYSIQSIAGNLRSKVKKVLLYKEDYPSLNLPFELGGFEVHYVENREGFLISLDDIMEIVQREKIEAIAISHVQYLTGFTIDIEALGKYCREQGIVFILDATQSFSAVELDFNALDVDVLISSSYKWLNGGPGSAVMAIKEDFIKRFSPRSAGYGSMTVDGKGLNYSPSIKSYEPGHLNPLGLLQLEKAVEERIKTGIPKIREHNKTLISRLAKGLAETQFKVCGGTDASHLSTILCFFAKQEIHEMLLQNNIFTTWRNGLIRVSPHFYNTEEDIDHLLAVLTRFSHEIIFDFR